MKPGATGFEPLAPLIAHEYFHDWNHPGLDGAAVHWFTEGFTTYYEPLSAVRTEPLLGGGSGTHQIDLFATVREAREEFLRLVLAPQFIS